jgi:hypothetical protein
MSETLEGGCLCGAVRYRATGPVTDPAFCHCRTCRGASAAPAGAWITVARDALVFTKGTPRSYRSSERVVRTFCAECGTPLTYANDKYPAAIDVTTCSLDAPERFAPVDHVWTSHALPWTSLGDLPRHPKFRA